MVFEAVERRRTTVLMVTHNVREALQHSDTILVLGPRPTSVVETIRLDWPRATRDNVWLGSERQKLLAAKTGFLDVD